MLPLRLVLTVNVEYLDEVIFTVGDIDPALVIGGDIMDDVQLTGIRVRFTP